MTIKTVRANLLLETNGIIVHGANAQGAMGSGFAQVLCNKYPQVKRDYLNAYRRGHGLMENHLALGQVIVTLLSDTLVVVSGVTQEFYGRDPNRVYVDYPAIRTVFKEVNLLALRTRLPVKFPLIGCGLAKGEWGVVEKIIEDELDPTIEASLFVL